MEWIDVTPDTVTETCLFCIRNPNHPGHRRKAAWFDRCYEQGLRMRIARADEGAQAAFIEYVPIEAAWRPVAGRNWMFIHCLMTVRKEHRGRGYASMLVRGCEEDARAQGMHGVAVLTSDGSWIASGAVFERLGYVEVERSGRFQLLAHTFDSEAELPEIRNWQQALARYSGWHLLYAHQCPWMQKSVADLSSEASAAGIDLQVHELTSPLEAQHAPSGYGVFALVRDGTLLADHYVSRTRFKNILKAAL